jgi:outer membrane protein assembly factor BamE (lipoprotein component of BamABCDE complex)
VWNRILAIIGVSIASFSLSGCLIIPTNYYTGNSRHNIAEELPANIVPGNTIREEVLLILGEPDTAFHDDSELWYTASKVLALWFLLRGGGEIIINYNHVIRFDSNGIVNALRANSESFMTRRP